MPSNQVHDFPDPTLAPADIDLIAISAETYKIWFKLGSGYFVECVSIWFVSNAV